MTIFLFFPRKRVTILPHKLLMTTNNTVWRWEKTRFFTLMTKSSHRKLFASLLNVLKWIFFWLWMLSDDGNPFSSCNFSHERWNFPIENFTQSLKTHFHSFPWRFGGNRNEITEEKCKNMLGQRNTLIRKKLPLLFSCCLYLSFPLLHHEFLPVTEARGFFDLCLVKAQVRSALNLCEGKFYFRKFFLRFLSLSLSFSLTLFSLFTGVWFHFSFRLIVVALFNFVVCAAFDANHEKKVWENVPLMIFLQNFFSFGEFFLWVSRNDLWNWMIMLHDYC